MSTLTQIWLVVSKGPRVKAASQRVVWELILPTFCKEDERPRMNMKEDWGDLQEKLWFLLSRVYQCMDFLGRKNRMKHCHGCWESLQQEDTWASLQPPVQLPVGEEANGGY